MLFQDFEHAGFFHQVADPLSQISGCTYSFETPLLIHQRQNSRLRYIVAVPLRPDVTLKYVQKYAPDAVLAKARYGDYVQAGRYASVERAESISYDLRSHGLDARVITD